VRKNMDTHRTKIIVRNTSMIVLLVASLWGCALTRGVKNITGMDESIPIRGNLCRLSALEEALADYQQIALRGGWPQIPSGPTLGEGDEDKRIPLIRQRLTASGELNSAKSTSYLFDRKLRKAVQRFQRHHGLTADGRVGGKTLHELNVSIGERIRQLDESLQGCRSLKPLEESRHIVVNIPDFTLTLFDGHHLLFSMPVIVGTPARQTPVFHSRIHALVINPNWTVPQIIATEDLIPRVKKDPNHLKDSKFRILKDLKTNEEIDPDTIDWENLSPEKLTYRFRQDSGPANALGRVKFLLPNPYDIYLHGTPGQSLFLKDIRAFSSGCIRLARPLELAAYLLKGTPMDSERTLQAAISSEKTQKLTVPHPLDIYIIYMMAWVDEDGAVQFRPDIYKRHTAM